MSFEVALDGANETFDFSFAPGVVGLGVQKPDAEVGADDLDVMVDEGPALIGVEAQGQSAPQDGLLEAVQEGGRVASQIISGKGDEPAVVIEDDAKLSGDHFALGASQRRSASEVHHPQFVGRGSLEGFLRAALQPSCVQTGTVVTIRFEEPVNRTRRGQALTFILPVAIEHLSRGTPGFSLMASMIHRALSSPIERLFARVGTGGLSREPAVAASRVVIPPGFQRAIGVVFSFLAGPWARGSLPQALGEGNSRAEARFDLADDLKAQKREAFLGRWGVAFHARQVLSRRFAPFQ